jgi:hypothetical protein
VEFDAASLFLSDSGGLSAYHEAYLPARGNPVDYKAWRRERIGAAQLCEVPEMRALWRGMRRAAADAFEKARNVFCDTPT